ncbi:hypothetical protein BH09BAC2_BH09BAC2_14000 [soil metagenome]
MKKILLLLSMYSVHYLNAQVNTLSENFSTAPPAGWTVTNSSSSIGITSWFQGNSSVFSAFSNPPTAYVGVNYNSTTGTNTISNWLFSPLLNLNDGSVFSFYTRTVDAPAFPDRLEVRLSTNGASTNNGGTANSVGDFTTLLVSVNPSLTTAEYPNVWTQYSVTLSGIGGAYVPGIIAFRYFVTNGGPTGLNSDYIGIDNVIYTAAAPLPVSLVSFTGTKTIEGVQLKWNVASQQGIRFYEIEKSADAANFKNSGRIAANNLTETSYAFTDVNPNSGTTFYRLKIIEDNKNSYSRVIRVVSALKPVTISPNPIVSVFTLQTNNTDLINTDAQIVSVTGKLIRSFKITSIPMNVDASNLSSGIYMLKLADGNMVKLMKQ